MGGFGIENKKLGAPCDVIRVQLGKPYLAASLLKGVSSESNSTVRVQIRNKHRRNCSLHLTDFSLVSMGHFLSSR